MIVSYDLEESEASGKHKFISRLRVALKKLGCQDPAEGQTADIHLFVRKHDPFARRNVCRLDGVCVNSELTGKGTCSGINRNIRDRLSVSTGAVFQNEFCREAVRLIVSREFPPANTCILNGADPEEFAVEPLVRERPYFMSLCHWRPHKRLTATVEGFLAAGLGGHDLLIFGETPPDAIQHPQVHYMGWHNREALAAALRGSVAAVHLAWLDWCPNSVVESIAAGKRVIYTTSGGTKYIVKDRGYAVQDAEWDGRLHPLYNPPLLNVDEIAQAYVNAAKDKPVPFDISDIHIDSIARQYYDFFVAVLQHDGEAEKFAQKELALRLAEEKAEYKRLHKLANPKPPKPKKPKTEKPKPKEYRKFRKRK